MAASLNQPGGQSSTLPEPLPSSCSAQLSDMSISNPEPCILSGPRLLHELALAGAHDANAIEFLAADGNIRCLSYQSLDHLSSKLAAEIARASKDRRPGGKFVVPVLLPQSQELYISWLGILKAGGAFCPLNIDAPPERIEFILQDVAASVVITQSSLAARVPQNRHLAVINADAVETTEVDVSWPTRKSSSSDLAYVMYTSGSTGRPKGVGVSHLAATQSLLAHDALIPQFSRFLQFASPTFDVSVFEVFFPFMRGATLVGSEREHMLLDISHVMTEMRVDAAELTPTVAGELLRTRAAAPHLRVLLTIGEMLTKHVVEEFGQSETSSGILHGMYGPTEAAIHCTAAIHFQASSRVNLIGRPFTTVSAFIMSLASDDESAPQDISPLPLGEIGELVVGGPQLADGYINRPEENAKAFIYSPQYGRLYRTGDKAKMLPSGDIECFGRISSGQVKLRGQRIELGEIEHIICRAPDVRSAVAIVSSGSLVAFVLVSDKGTTDRELRDICRQWLPRFMVPGEFILVNQFPQLPSGKIDRKALEAEFASHRNRLQSLDQQSFRDETEETIASCVTDVLGRKLPPSESLVAAGLDSLAAIRLASHLLDVGIRLDVAHLLDADSVEGIWHLAKDLESTQLSEDTQSNLHSIRQLVADAGAARIESLGISSHVTEVEPCSPIQQAMILETVRHARAYCNWIELEFHRPITSTAVHLAFHKLLEQNPLLRSGFVEIGLKDHPYACFTWKDPDECSVQRRDEFEYDIDLVEKSDLLHPLRIQLKEAPEGLRALVHIHHALYDGWSWQLMLREFHHILLGEKPPPKPSYRVVTDFFIQHRLSESANKSSLFWREQLQGCPVASFPHFQTKTDIPAGTQEATRMLETSMSKLNDVSQSLKVSRQTIFQAAFCYLLSTYLGSEDVVFGTVFSGRTLPVKGIETVLGPCIRTLPTRINLGKMQTVKDLLLAIQNMNRKSLEHGSLPLHEIKKLSGIDLRRNLFDTAVVWQESIWSNESRDAPFREVSAAEFLEFALLLEFEPREDKVYSKATYQQSILSRDQVQILLEQIDLVASILVESPVNSIDEISDQLSLVTLSHYEANLEVNNAPSTLLNTEAIASTDPNRLAIEFPPSNTCQDVESVTYGQLNSRVNRLVHHLMKNGVKPNTLVAAFLDGSVNSHVTLLAVAKIGAGLLPLETQMPSETITHILTAANVQFFLVDPSRQTGDLVSLDAITQISILDTLDDYNNDLDAPRSDDCFYLVCADTSTIDDPTNQPLLSHHNLQSHIAALAGSLPTPAGSKMLYSYPQGSPGSILAALLAWHAGMTLCSIGDDYPTRRATEVINAMQVTHLHLTPALASRLTPAQVPSVQCLLTGAPLNAKPYKEWAGKGLYQGYNLSGLSSPCTVGRVDSTMSLSSIGKTLGDTSATIITGQEDLRLLPRGALGELCFGSSQLGRVVSGSKVTSEGRFLEHPRFGRLYRTGDYGRLLPDGTILLLPRQGQTRLHGQHLALGEIDSALVSSTLVADSTSMVSRNPLIDQQQVVAFWVPSRHASEDLDLVAKDLLQELENTLPSSLMPALLIPIDEFPLTPSHGIDYAKLQQDVKNMSPAKLRSFSLEVDTGDHEDLTDVEKTIAGALSTITGIEQQNIQPHTSFYKLGLDSLSAISFSRQLQNCGLGKFAVSTILQHSSVAQLALVAPALANGHSNLPKPQETKSTFDEAFVHGVKDELKAEGMGIEGIYPCTPLQEAMLAAESDVHSAYFNHLLLRVNVNAEELQNAWIQMQQRHEILRTIFKQTNDKRFAYAQVVLESADLPWHSVEISHDLKDAIEKQKSEFEFRSPVNGDLPYALTLFKDLNNQHTYLLLSIHHALYDGEGITQLLQEIQTSLAGQQLPEVVPFHRFISHMVSTGPNTSDKFWDRYLSGVSPSLLSAPQSQSPTTHSVSHQIHVNLNESLTSFKRHCQELSVTPLNVLHAAWARLLVLHADTSDVCFGNVFSCRTVPLEGADRIVGPCFNTLPMRINLSATSTNADVLKLARKHNSDILPHQLSPLRRIQRRVAHGGSQLFDTLVIFQGSHTELDPGYWELIEDEGNMGLPLICEAVPDEKHDTLRICLHFHASYLTADVAERLTQSFLDLVEHTIQYPAAQASDNRFLGADMPQLCESKQSLANGRFSSTGSDISRPWSYQEEALRDILCKFSGVDPGTVLLHTTIFQLGLDSINAVQISAKLRNLGYKISAGDILEAASIDNIAALLKTGEKGATVEEFDFVSFENQHLQSICAQLDIHPQMVQALRPCTPVQNGMLALFTHSNGSAYFNRMSLKSPAPLDKELLKNAWSMATARHEMLRTGFVHLHNQKYPFAMVTYHEDLDVPWHEVKSPMRDEPRAQEQQILANLHQPPWRISIQSCDESDTMHFSVLHALYDAQSLATIFLDVEAAYKGFDLASPASITETLGPILIESQKQSETAQGFWQEIASETRPSKFPDLHPTRTDRRTLFSASISSSQSIKALESSCRELGVTLQAAGQVAWARLLAAYTGEQNVTFGTVLSGRNLSTASQDAVFPCLVTVPSPAQIDGTNRELLDRTLKRNASLTRHQFTPLAEIQRWIGSDEPLFDTLFVYQKFASSVEGSGTWVVNDEETNIDYPISIELVPHSASLELRISCRSDIVPEEQALLILNQYDKLLEQTVCLPDTRSEDYTFLGDSMLSITPAKERSLPTSVSLLHQFVEQNAENIPEKVAFEFAHDLKSQKETWSYRQLNEDGNRMAHFLQSMGAAPGEMIAICFDKCPEASIAILGILKAGCAYLAIDPTAPISRKQFILEDSGTRILLCNRSRKSEHEELSGVNVQAVDEPGILDGFSSAQPLLSREIRADDTCYCLYTSGTTGTPKGCGITHDNAVQAMLAFQRLFSPHWNEESRWLQFASFHFDVSVLEQYWSWSVGICVTSCPRDLLFEDLPGTIQKLQITHIDLTPSLAKLVHPDEVPSLCNGVFITGGEALKQEILDAWGKHGVIYNGYGPTEVTIGCTMLPRMRANDKASNIGPQFDNVGSYVFRPGTSTPVLRGGLGELCVSGPLVGKGYLNRPELTQERFQALPEYEDRIYRTGDLVRILHDGSFQFLGRIDDQVKLRGQRLEIGEINEIIKQSTPDLNEVATLVVQHPEQAKDQLVSFVTRLDAAKKPNGVEVSFSQSDCELLSTIKSACHAHLPGYMVPTHLIPLTRFPLSANNKADMKVLKGIYKDLSLGDIQKLTSMTVDRTMKGAREEEIISVLAKFLGTTESAISSWSSIYGLGLDSISVISFSRDLREAGFPRAQSSLIMKHPTVAGMALALQTPSNTPFYSSENLHRNAKQAIQAFSHKHSHSLMENIGVAESNVEQIAPCTPLQEGIIYHFLSSSKPLYCSSFTFELLPTVDLEKLQSAWKKTQFQVQMLRARFVPSSDGYAQVILKKSMLPWFQIEAGSEKNIDRARKQQHDNWVSRLDGLFTHAWEAGVVVSSRKSVMCLSIFHALYDGNSLSLLLDLVSRNYLDQEGVNDGAPNFLDVLHLGPLCKDPSAETFWKKKLENCQYRPLPSSDLEKTSVTERLQIDSTEHLDHLRRSLNVTEQAVLHACWLLTLHQYYNFVPTVGIIASGRVTDIPGIAKVAGPLFNTLPSNVQIQGLKSWSEIAQKCHEYHVSTIPYQYTALRDIVKWLGKSPDEPLFDSLYVFQREDPGTESSTSLWVPYDSDAQHEYPLAFEIVRNNNDTLTVTLAAKGHILSAGAAQHLLTSFEENLLEFSKQPNHELPCINGVSEDAKSLTNRPIAESTHPEVDGEVGDLQFPWSDQACTIRDAVVSIAGVDVQSVNEKTSIFEVGLDSIDAIKLSSRLSKSGIKLPVSAIMRHRNVKAMVSQLEMEAHPEPSGTYSLLGQMEAMLTASLEREGLLPQDTDRVLPATPIQEAMIAEMTSSGYQHYYNHEILEIEPGVDLKRLQEAWKAVVSSHPILRTSFVEVWDPAIATSYAQIVHGEDVFDAQTIELNGATVESVIEQQRSRAPVELAHRPLLTLTTAFDGDKSYLVLSIAHALYDGWSINLLHEDVARSYAGEFRSRPSSDAILEQIIASSGDRALKFWRAVLSNCPPALFPRRKHADEHSNAVHRAEKALSVSSEKAEAFCKRHGITMQALFVSCWSLVLAANVNNLDVVFGLVLSGRNVADSEHVLFPTMNTVAMRVILHGTRLELVKYVQETLLEMSEHQHFPLRRARPDAGSRQLFDSLFIYQKRPSSDVNDGLALYKSTGGASNVEYPVCAEVEGDGKDLVGRVACRGSVMGESETFALLDHLAHVLSSIVDEPAHQTVDFSGDAASICGHSVGRESSTQVVQNGTSPEVSTTGRWSPIESIIRSVLSAVSGIPEDSINKETTIFHLGLDSISAIKVAALMKRRSVKLAVSDMLRAGTIEKMAEAANANHAELTPADIDRALEESLDRLDIASLLDSYGIDANQIQRTIPATSGQTYFLAMHALNPLVFYPEFHYLASVQLRPQELESAWSRLAGQFSILRTAFLPTSTQRLPYVQIVFKTVDSPVIWQDSLADPNAAAQAIRGIGAVPATLLASQTERGTALTLRIHHALYDAVSLPSIMEHFARLCQGPSESKPEVHDMSQLVAAQHARSPVEARRQFWQRYLGSIATHGVSEKGLGEFGAVQQYYRPGLVAHMSRVEAAGKRQSLSVQSIFLAVLARVHSQVLAALGCSSEDIRRGLVVGLYLANRSHMSERLSELIAPTVNIVPLRLDDKIGETPESLVVAARRIQDEINEISRVEYCGVSLVEIAEWTGIHVHTCVNFLRVPEQDDSVPGNRGRVSFRPLSREEVAGFNRRNLDGPTPSPNGGTTGMSNPASGPGPVTAALGNVFWPTIDVEAALRHGRLDFGLFAPETRLDSSTAEAIIEGMRQAMEAWGESELV